MLSCVMPRAPLAALILVACCVHGPRTRSDTLIVVPSAPSGMDIVEEVVRVPIAMGSAAQSPSLEATVFRRSGAGPFPLVVISHGAIGQADPRPRWRPVAQVSWFITRGFDVVVPMRRRNAGSAGPWAEGFGPCGSADFDAADREAVRDLGATLSQMAMRPEVDATRVVLVGVSAGGMASLGAATELPGVVGVVNFAGGRGSWSFDGGATRFICSPERLIAAFGRIGTASTHPCLWLYAVNDRFFPPAMARSLFEAFTANGGHARLVALRAYGNDGHAVFPQPGAMPMWTGEVDRFLREIGL